MVYSEECFEISLKNEFIRGIIHKGNNGNVLIYCPGLAGDRVDCHRIPVDFGRYAVKNGWDLIRFDYRGIGVSDGNTILYGFNDILDDIEAVINYARHNYCKIALIGISQAAIQTYYLANKSDMVDILLLWSPLFDKDNSTIRVKDTVNNEENKKNELDEVYIKKAWNSKHEELSKGKTVARNGDVIRISKKFLREKSTGLFGYPNTGMWISSKYYEERKKILEKFVNGNRRKIRIALFRGEFDESVINDQFTQKLAEENGMYTIKNGDHLFSDVFCRHVLFEKSIQWLNSVLY